MPSTPKRQMREYGVIGHSTIVQRVVLRAGFFAFTHHGVTTELCLRLREQYPIVDLLLVRRVTPGKWKVTFYISADQIYLNTDGTESLHHATYTLLPAATY